MAEQSAGTQLRRRSSTVLQQRVVQQERAELLSALDAIQGDTAIAEAAARVVAARRRLVIGSGKSHVYAHLLAYELGVGLSQVTLIDGAVVRAVDQLTDVRAGDVMIAFSLRRYRRDTVDIARAFADAGGHLVTITDAADAPLAPLADQAIVVGADPDGGTVSPTLVTAVVHVLATLTTASAKGARRRLGERDRLTRDLGLYLTD